MRSVMSAPLGIGNTVAAPLVVIRTIAPAVEPGVEPGREVGKLTAIHKLLSGPATIASYLPDTGRVNSVTMPLGVIRATRSLKFSVNQMLPSEPATICAGSEPLRG